MSASPELVEAGSLEFIGWAFKGDVNSSSKDGSFSLLKEECVSIHRADMYISIQVVPQSKFCPVSFTMQDFFLERRAEI